jgi:hypothetical protein
LTKSTDEEGQGKRLDCSALLEDKTMRGAAAPGN